MIIFLTKTTPAGKPELCVTISNVTVVDIAFVSQTINVVLVGGGVRLIEYSDNRYCYDGRFFDNCSIVKGN